MDYLWEKEQWRKIVSNSDVEGLKEKSPISRTWVLLVGFVLENLIKGTIIAQNPNYISNGRLNTKVSDHRLLDLSEAIVDFNFTDNDRDMLNILESCIPSWGRYPIPKKIEDIKQEVPTDVDLKSTFDSLFERLDRFIYDMLKEDWAGPHECILREYIRSEMENMDLDKQYKIIEDLSLKMKNKSSEQDDE